MKLDGVAPPGAPETPVLSIGEGRPARTET